MAAIYVPGADGCIPCKAYTDLSSYQYHFMKIITGGTGLPWTVTIADADGDLGLGVLINKPAAAGEEARVFTQAGGVVPVILGSGGAVTLGAQLTADASGHAIAAVDGDICLGIALETGGAAGDLIHMLCVSPYHVADVSFYLTGA